ncbi:amino acid permease [Demequina litorisediminis]|uniref:amino acid permease n=1 Tax=Demequina litorisediminis TaxID=1849022 RepID=UPI0024E08381|nr:APC family permease [Demequina litorisediminis]
MTDSRRIGPLSATGIGVGSMLGAGVFSDMWVDVLAVGRWAIAAVVCAGLVALLNALSTAQACRPLPGRGRCVRLRACGARAIRRASRRRGVRGGQDRLGGGRRDGVGRLRPARARAGHRDGGDRGGLGPQCAGGDAHGAGATLIALIVVTALAVIVALSWRGDPSALGPAVPVQAADSSAGTAFLVAVAACFFAFAGYARIATLGEEVRDPSRTIVRAILGALAVVVVLYVGVAAALVRLGPERLTPTAGADGEVVKHDAALAPIAQLARLGGVPVWLVTVVAALSVGGAMLAVMAGAGRTAMAMAREGDLPRGLARQGSSGAPWRAEAAIALGAVALVWTSGTSLVLVSAATILTYYAVANLAAARQSRAGRTAGMTLPWLLPLLGLVASLTLAVVALAQASDGWWAAALVMVVVVGWPVAAAVVRRRGATK